MIMNQERIELEEETIEELQYKHKLAAKKFLKK